jgi:hypothetical protein
MESERAREREREREREKRERGVHNSRLRAPYKRQQDFKVLAAGQLQVSPHPGDVFIRHWGIRVGSNGIHIPGVRVNE